MAQQRSSKGTAKKGGTKKASAKKGTAKKAPAKKASAKKTPAKKASAKKAPAKKAGAKKSPGRKTAKGGAKRSATESPEKSVQAFREALEQSVIAPRNIVMISRDRIQEVMDDAVQRGRMTRDDANLTVQRLVRRGRRETDDVLGGLEDLLQSARRQAQDVVDRVGRRARDTADPALKGMDTARRATGAGQSFPVTGYDELTASQVRSRLGKLTPAELRKVRDYEKRSGNRKTILNEIDKQLKAS